MKLVLLYKTIKGQQETELMGCFDTLEEAQEKVMELVNDGRGETVFDFYTEEHERWGITDKVKSYADACDVLGIEPMDEQGMRGQGFRPDEIARRKLETITEALNEGWKPAWNDTDEHKYYPYFYVNNGAKGKGRAGLAFAYTHYAASVTAANFGSRLCFQGRELARYAGSTFTDLYEQILIDDHDVD